MSLLMKGDTLLSTLCVTVPPAYHSPLETLFLSSPAVWWLHSRVETKTVPSPNTAITLPESSSPDYQLLEM